MTFNIKKQKPFNSILRYLPRLRGSRKSEDASRSLGDKIVSKFQRGMQSFGGSPRSILPLRRFTSPTRGLTPWTTALMYMKGFASFTKKGNDEQAQVCITTPEAGREEQSARSVRWWEPRCAMSGKTLDWKVPGVCVTFTRAVLWMCKCVLPELCIQFAYKELLVFCSIQTGANVFY